MGLLFYILNVTAAEDRMKWKQDEIRNRRIGTDYIDLKILNVSVSVSGDVLLYFVIYSNVVLHFCGWKWYSSSSDKTMRVKS